MMTRLSSADNARVRSALKSDDIMSFKTLHNRLYGGNFNATINFGSTDPSLLSHILLAYNAYNIAVYLLEHNADVRYCGDIPYSAFNEVIHERPGLMFLLGYYGLNQLSEPFRLSYNRKTQVLDEAEVGLDLYQLYLQSPQQVQKVEDLSGSPDYKETSNEVFQFYRHTFVEPIKRFESQLGAATDDSEKPTIHADIARIYEDLAKMELCDYKAYQWVLKNALYHYTEALNLNRSGVLERIVNNLATRLVQCKAEFQQRSQNWFDANSRGQQLDQYKSVLAHQQRYAIIVECGDVPELVEMPEEECRNGAERLTDDTATSTTATTATSSTESGAGEGVDNDVTHADSLAELKHSATFSHAGTGASPTLTSTIADTSKPPGTT